MEKWKPQNMQLRSAVISKVLRLEQTSSSALRAIFRMFKQDSKTLGNSSSALPFKSKIDLLYDLEELSKTEYAHSLKLMEIRNQFAHNPNAVSFESFKEINNDIINYLLRNCPGDLEKEDVETKLVGAFNHLFQITAGKLMIIEVEYSGGIRKQIRQHVNDIIVKNIDHIWKQAMEKKKMQPKPIYQIFQTIDDDELDSFYNSFRIAMYEFSSAELAKIDIEKGEVFKVKETIEEQIEQKKLL
ncbi:hypothetical protein SAMN05216464_10893 [Mucilaginibacter pineti]|uniref:Uncharacterized protein n=1 Tax=Mucilaginibacter pineti TaxID=1391627 RepID=A0A1G7EMQ7_9SPHI|nr:hypothetical protein [Mucilaginibacter pineti]SDE64993.1 hypothetical protein SAMN05216464_10893 [Mucilaginibacter pineti]